MYAETIPRYFTTTRNDNKFEPIRKRFVYGHSFRCQLDFDDLFGAAATTSCSNFSTLAKVDPYLLKFFNLRRHTTTK